MGVLIPVGYGNATYVFQSLGAPRACTFSIGYNPDAINPALHATLLRDGLGVNTGIFTAADVYAGWTWTKVQVTEMDESGPMFYELPVNLTGTAVGQAPATNTALLISKKTAFGGRKNKGRMYWPPWSVSETQIDQNGFLDPTYRGIRQGQITDYLGDLASNDIPAVLLHSEPGLPTPITSLILESQVATQRRRMRR